MNVGKTLKIGCLGVVIFFSMVIGFFIIVEKKFSAKRETIRNFPVIEGKLYTETPLEAPISGEMVAAVLLKSRGDSDDSWKSTSTSSNDDFFIVAENIEIEVEGKRYKLVGNTMNAYVSEGKRVEVTEGKRIIDDRYVGVDDILDSNLKAHGLETKDGPIEVGSTYIGYGVEEFIYKNGESIQIKGRIEDDQVIVLTWEDAH